MDAPYLTAQEVATLLRIKLQTVYNLVHAQQLAPHRIGKDLRFERESIEDFLRRRTPVSLDEAGLITGIVPDERLEKVLAELEEPWTVEAVRSWKNSHTDPRQAGIVPGIATLTLDSLTQRAKALADATDTELWLCGLCPPEAGAQVVVARCITCERPVCLACSDIYGTSPRRPVFGASRICLDCLRRRQPSPAPASPRAIPEDRGPTDRLVSPRTRSATSTFSTSASQVRGNLRRSTLYGG